MRLDKFIGHTSDLSRRDIHRAIKRGEVMINGAAAPSPSLSVSAQDQITLQGRPLAAPTLRYFMLHKPAGVLSARTDAHQPCVLDLIDTPRKDTLQIVGRLDKDTTGLLLLTDDGQWNHRITSPRSACAKVYEVATADVITADAVERFAKGILLKNDSTPTRPATLELLGERRARVTLQEGRYHQVKRMFAATGNRVTELHRTGIGNIVLDPQLSPGDFRPLTAEEIAHV